MTCGDKDRPKITEKVIDLAHSLLALNNYHCCFAVFAGASHSSVLRLKMWEKMPKVKEKLATLETLFDPSSNHKNYQQALLKTDKSQSVVPLLSIYSKYLFAIEENNSDWISDKADYAQNIAEENRMINVEKLRMLFVLIKKLRQFQRVAYSSKWSSNELYAQVRCNKLQGLEEKEMYEKSWSIQPKV